jgi:hypothetical protein
LLLLFDASDLCLEFWLLKLFCKVLERFVSGSFRENLFQFSDVSFSPAPIWLTLSLLNLKYYLTYQKQICLNKSFCLTMVLYFAIICVHECVKKTTYLLNFYRTSLGVRRLSSVVCRLSSVNFSHFKLLLRNHLADWNRT